MDIPMGAYVICNNGACGRSTNVVSNPVTENETHFVVAETNLPYVVRLAPIDEVQKYDPRNIYLYGTRSKRMRKMPTLQVRIFSASNNSD